jgi:hypothetical protein
MKPPSAPNSGVPKKSVAASKSGMIGTASGPPCGDWSDGLASRAIEIKITNHAQLESAPWRTGRRPAIRPATYPAVSDDDTTERHAIDGPNSDDLLSSLAMGSMLAGNPARPQATIAAEGECEEGRDRHADLNCVRDDATGSGIGIRSVFWRKQTLPQA